MSSANLNGKSVVIDQSKAEAFAGRMLDVLNSSLLGLTISIGYQTHLFDIMSTLFSPSTTAAIAKSCKPQWMLRKRMAMDNGYMKDSRV
jgi:hypothetical protein